MLLLFVIVESADSCVPCENIFHASIANRLFSSTVSPNRSLKKREIVKGNAGRAQVRGVAPVWPFRAGKATVRKAWYGIGGWHDSAMFTVQEDSRRRSVSAALAGRTRRRNRRSVLLPMRQGTLGHDTVRRVRPPRRDGAEEGGQFVAHTANTRFSLSYNGDNREGIRTTGCLRCYME